MKSLKSASVICSSFMLIFLTVSILWASNFAVGDVTEFQNALTTAATNSENDTIVVAAGTYNVSSTLTFLSLENYSLTIIGAGIDSTILDGGNTTKALNIEMGGTTGDIDVEKIRFSNGNSVYGAGLYISTDASNIYVDSCEFTDNYVSGLGVGAGANCYSNTGDVSVSNCFFRRNDSYTEIIGGTWPEAGGRCGGLFVQISDAGSGSQITLSNSYFEDNTATVDAGAAMLYPLCSGAIIIAENNTFLNNHADDAGGGLWIRTPNINSTVQVHNNTFSGNSTVDTTFLLGGGGVYIEINTGNLDFYENTFSSNNSDLDGAGAWITLESGTINFTSSTFFDNYANYNGSAVNIFIAEGTLDFSRNILYSNEAANVGGALNLATNHATLNIFNNTFYNNTAIEGGGIYFYFDEITSVANVYNNILWQNTAPAIAYSGAIAATARYSDIEGGTGESWFGAGCFDANPLFFDTTAGDFHLTWTNFPTDDATKSPCIDTGDPTSPEDPDSTISDIGAFYFDQWSGIIDNRLIPKTPLVCKVYPNPFNSSVAIWVGLGDGAQWSSGTLAPSGATVKIYDINGKCVGAGLAPVSSGRDDRESRPRIWRPDESISSGIYLIKATTGEQTITKRAILIR